MKSILALLIFAALAQATAVTSITCSGQVATVNATAHGLVASQGFSLSGSSGTFNSTVGTAGGAVTANAFTFTLPTGTACAGFTSGYTVIVAAKQIIELGATAAPSAATVTNNYLYWFSTPYPNPLPCNLGTAGNVCPQSVWSGASAAENASIVAGTTVEYYGQATNLASTAAATVAAQAITQYNAMQAGFANFLLAGGYYWNGLAWAHQ
jgi:hypothetical protein